MLWEIIKRAIRDIEINNKLEFGNESWNRLKEMEREIYQWQERVEKEYQSARIWNALTDNQQLLLRQSVTGADVLTHEERKMREALQLEERGYIRLVFNERHGRAYAAHITIFGRELLNSVKEGK
jgi:hypothetical protein